jgi:hypothetical protein
MVEPQFSKLDVAGSSPVPRSLAHLAQSVEQCFCKAQVVSSILTVGSKEREDNGNDPHFIPCIHSDSLYPERPIHMTTLTLSIMAVLSVVALMWNAK